MGSIVVVDKWGKFWHTLFLWLMLALGVLVGKFQMGGGK